MKIAYQNAGSRRDYHHSIATSTNLKEAISTSLFKRLYGKFSYTEKGVTMKQEIETEILEVEEHVFKLITQNRTKALDILKS